MYLESSLSSQNNLVSAVMHICDKNGLNFAEYICSSHSDFKRTIEYNAPCGIADSVIGACMLYSLVVITGIMPGTQHDNIACTRIAWLQQQSDVTMLHNAEIWNPQHKY